ncbi:MAG TPA: hypothetical protein VGN72_18585 [Tepidisphaeraceae bacterium]|jgi:hypothetical protein|nr:hypothetical protein [Tepidisphaeraceae bacterium]
MTPRALIPSILGLAMLVAGGCNTKTYNFSVAVKNESSEPVMVGFAKDGPPFENNWATPEQVARMMPRPDERGWGIPVAPGKVAEVENEKAQLERSTTAYLRVYATAPSLDSMLAISSGSPNRLDIPLRPGENKIVVTREGGQLKFQRLNP